MPLLTTSTYKTPPFYLFNGHLETIIPSIFRKIEGITYQRERLELADGDFLDLDWLTQSSDKLIIVTHGLEGNSDRHYVKGCVKLFHENGWDALAWNCRSCSGEMNRNLRMYHHGEIEDIQTVMEHAIKRQAYKEIYLIGFSMGGNITLKYLGVHGKNVPKQLKGAVTFSAPCDLTSSAALLDAPQSLFYKQKFYRKLVKKMRIKAEQYPGVIDMNQLAAVRSWRDFDERFSAPLNGFKDAQAFYDQASSINYIEGIHIPTLLVNAQNDPILTKECSPATIARSHPFFYLETPAKGGHVGFAIRGEEYTWMELRALVFFEDLKKRGEMSRSEML